MNASSLYSRLALLLAIAMVIAGATGCQSRYETICPDIYYIPQQAHITNLPSPFDPLSDEECNQDWGKEYRIGLGFSCEMDLYRAITAYKRALFLLPCECCERRQQIEYEVMLCYYLGLKFQEAVEVFECSSLKEARSSFPAYRTLLIMLYECYENTCQDIKAETVRSLITQHNPAIGEDLLLATALEQGDFCTIQDIGRQHPSGDHIHELLCRYEAERLSAVTAQTLNGLLPGAGYLYVGQRRSAVTAFLVNSLFIWATAYFFDHSNIPAGIICAGFEAGWYLGGINGAGIAAKLYNESLYNGMAKDFMCQERLFPVLMLNQAF